MPTILAELAACPTVASAIDAYLSVAHRDNPGAGCPLAVNGDELSRADAKAWQVATEGFMRLIDVLAGKGATAARRKAPAAVTMSRVVTNAKLSDEILRETRKSLDAG